MFDLDRWQEIWMTITRNKIRSILTAFGVFWGIFMLVVLSGSGNGLKNGIMENVKGVATNTAFFFTHTTTEPYKGFRKGRAWTMNMDDVNALKSNLKGIRYVAPMLFMWGGEGNNTFYKDKAGAFQVMGNVPDYGQIVKQDFLYGRYINEIDMQERRKVCVIGKRVYEQLFGNGVDPLNAMIKVKGIYYQVIGVVQKLTNVNIGGDPEEMVVLPYSTMQQAYNIGNNIYFMAITAQQGMEISAIEKDIKTLLKVRHDISPLDNQAIGSFNMEQQFKMFEYLFLGVNILIWIIGMGTLLAGIVGISNIMVVTVRERTKEIGVRRALGAKPKAIIMQIMLESLLLTILAGIIGLMLGVGLMAIVDHFVSMPKPGGDMSFFKSPQIGFGAAIAATFVLIISGLIAGLIPAGRAMRIKAIDAIREE